MRNTALSVSLGFGIPPRCLDEIRKFPMLEPSEEFTLAKAWCDAGDREPGHWLVDQPPRSGSVGMLVDRRSVHHSFAGEPARSPRLARWIGFAASLGAAGRCASSC